MNIDDVFEVISLAEGAYHCELEVVRFVNGESVNRCMATLIENWGPDRLPILQAVTEWIKAGLADVPDTHILVYECQEHIRAHGMDIIEEKISQHARDGNLEAITVSINNDISAEDIFFVIMFARDSDALAYMNDFSLGFDALSGLSEQQQDDLRLH